MTLSMTAMSSLKVQYGLMSCCNWSLCSGQPCMIYSLRHCTFWSSDVIYCSSCIVIHSSMLVAVCIALILNCIPGISASLFWLWFCLDSQSATKRSFQACIWFSLCIDVFLAEFAIVSVIVLLCLFLILWLVVCDLELYSSLLWSSNGGILQAHIVCLMLLFLSCCTLFSFPVRLFAGKHNTYMYAVV